MRPRSYLGWINRGSASIRSCLPWILAAKQLKNYLDLRCRCSYTYHLFLMLLYALNCQHNPSIFTSESTVDTLDFQFKKKSLLSCPKKMQSFWDAGSNLDSAFIFYVSYFQQLQHLHFLCHQVMLWMLFSSFSYGRHIS